MWKKRGYMTTVEQNINTGSTGGLGSQLRSESRRYVNYPYGVVKDLNYLQRFVRLGHETISRGRQGVTRAVMRVLLPENILHRVVEMPSLMSLLESAVPTSHTDRFSGGNRIWMVMGAINHPDRRPLHSVDQMIRDIDAMKQVIQVSSQLPANRVQNLREEGYQFIDSFSPERIAELMNLWGNTFQWDEDGIVKFRENIWRMRGMRPSQRGFWFSGIIEPRSNVLVAVAQGERLDMPISDGRSIPIVESTEWRRSDSTSRHGLAAAAVVHLNAQILSDLGSQYPLIIAETNYSSRAHAVGFAARMEVPPRNIGNTSVQQVLIQNVCVGDGYQPEGRRDFTMMYIPPENTALYYSQQQREQILGRGLL